MFSEYVGHMNFSSNLNDEYDDMDDENKLFTNN